MIESGLIFNNGIPKFDYIVFNPLEVELIDVVPVFYNITLRGSNFWNELKSITWCANCRFFFVFYKNHIVIGNAFDNEAILCTNLSMNVFTEFLKTNKL